MTRLLRRISQSILAQLVMARVELGRARGKIRLETARANELERRLRVIFAENAADAVRLDEENAILRGFLRAIAAGADDPMWVAARALGETAGSGVQEATA